MRFRWRMAYLLVNEKRPLYIYHYFFFESCLKSLITTLLNSTRILWADHWCIQLRHYTDEVKMAIDQFWVHFESISQSINQFINQSINHSIRYINVWLKTDTYIVNLVSLAYSQDLWLRILVSRLPELMQLKLVGLLSSHNLLYSYFPISCLVNF